MADPTVSEPTSSSAPSASTGRPVYLRIAIGLMILAGFVVLGRSAGGYVPQFAAWVEGLGSLGPIVFMLGYALAVVAFIPGSILTLAAGAIFGLLEGTLYVFIAAVVGSTLAFLIARHGARASIEKRIEGDARFEAIDRAVGVEGRKIVLLLRLSPVFPFNLLNYALGLTRVGLVDYLIASFGMLPGTLLFVYTGKLAGDVAAIAGGVETERGPAGWLVLGLGFAATLVVTIYITRIAKRSLAAATESNNPIDRGTSAHD
jgi:uncharacterized membrane protein YdjX (TVP38/TMEM64 family)